MEILLRRIARRPGYTIGRLYLNGEYFCDTLEDTDRGLSQSMSLADLVRLKKKGVTAIPTGRYRVTLDVRSGKFSTRTAYAFCKGYLPRLVDVPAYEGVLIHIGNTAADTEGCILVGRNTQVGKVLQSTDTFRTLYARLSDATKPIYITII